MAGELSLLLEPGGLGVNGFGGEKGFAFPSGDSDPIYWKLRKQMAPIPKKYDAGKLRLPPKHRRPGMQAGEKTLVEMIGHSPDELDAVMLAVRGLLHKGTVTMAGAVS